MPPIVRALLVGLAVAFGVSLLLGAFGAAVGGPALAGDRMIPVVLGLVVAGAVGRLSHNRSEQRLNGAERETAVSLTPPPAAALLVITREGFVAKVLGIDVLVDGRRAVQLRSPRAAILPVAPGAHTVSAFDPNNAKRDAGAAANAPLDVQLAPGEVAFVQVRVGMALARNVITVERAADPARARARLASMPLVAPEPGWAADAAGV